MTIDDISWSKPRPTPPIIRVSCVVCGLRADCLICKECALNTEASIRWLETLPTSERIVVALEQLRRMG